MGVKMMKWRPWPPQQQLKKFEAKITVRSITGLQNYKPDVGDDDDEKIKSFDGLSRLMVKIQWKGSKANGLRSLKKKSVKTNCTNARELNQNGVVEFDQEFKAVCGFCGSKDKPDGVYLPWEVAFLVFNDSLKQSKKRGPLTAPTVLDLAEFASLEDAKELDITIPLSTFGYSFKCCPSLCISLSLTQLKTIGEISLEVQKPLMFSPLSPCFGGASQTIKKDESSTFKKSLRKVKSLTDYVSSKSIKKFHHGEGSSDSKFSTGSDSEYNYPFDMDSVDDSEECETQESNVVETTCGYGSLVHVNLVGALDLKINCNDDELVYYSNKEVALDSSPTIEEVTAQSKFGILAWKKRKLSFRSPKNKGEPLLKKDHREEGGDDIDFDRRQLSSDEMTKFDDLLRSGSYVSEFGDDNFAVGSWEEKELLSRDGSMKLKTKVFFASIDQRSERADGESACTTLVAVIADWLHANQGEMPIKSEFDSLIREGSLQWRNLCKDEDSRERFPDKHFDLETVMHAKIRPLVVVPDRSFIGFFHPEGLEEECFHFLKGAMSFDDIWDEICQAAMKLNEYSDPLVYIVSWNDHFFLLRIDYNAYYIIDTLGERLFEGCNQAFVLKFDKDTTIDKVSNQGSEPDEKSEVVEVKRTHSLNVGEYSLGSTNLEGLSDCKDNETVVCRGRESCKEYIKSFLAAIPIRELQLDMRKGLMASTPLHHRLQIEFNFTAQVLVVNDEGITSDGFPQAKSDELIAPKLEMESNVMASMTVDIPALTMAVSMAYPSVAVADVHESITTDVPSSVLALSVA